MRKTVLYALLSLDGVAESPDRYVFEFDDEMRANLRQVIESQDTVLLGRRTYDEWAPYWPTSTEEPFAGFINGVAKYVVTATTPAVAWPGSTVVDGSFTELVAELKGRPGGDIGVHGSIELARSLLRADLIDELRLVVTPTIAGEGRRLLEPGIDRRRLELRSSRSTPSGALLLSYRISRPGDGDAA